MTHWKNVVKGIAQETAWMVGRENIMHDEGIEREREKDKETLRKKRKASFYANVSVSLEN